jgi:C4-dicarboxylate-specific signal transduction histidine kinase
VSWLEQAAAVVETLRQSGIEPLGDLPWGAHICLFYEGVGDLLDVVVPYFSAGVRGNECCIWAVAEGVPMDEAKAALRREVPDLDRRLADGAVELVPCRDWYLPDSRFDLQRIVRGWHERLDEALARGFDGLRVSGDAFWVESRYRQAFSDYELELDESVAGRKLLVLCTYPAELSRAVDVLEVTRSHQLTLARRRGEWEVLETAELIRAKQELLRLKAELEDRVRLRTLQLAAANAQLETENQERERAEAALAEAQTELARAARLTSLGVLAASIAHEVNQPLAAILTNAEASLRLLAADPPDMAEALAALKQIAGDARRAGDVIKRLRSLVAGTAEHADVDINDAIREVAALMRSQLQARRVTLRLDLEPGDPHVLGDRLQLQQAIMNLVSNAVEAMGRAGGPPTVTIRSDVDADGAVVLSVEDQGPGVEPETADRLFDPFFTTKAGGMGMGLSIVRSVAEAHGGRLSLSAGPRAGAVFQLTIPSRRAAP